MKSIIVPATVEAPGAVTDFVTNELESSGCPSKALFQIEVAIEEIMVNIVSYARLSDGDGIEVRCEILDDPTRVVLQFLDRGIPFDPMQ